MKTNSGYMMLRIKIIIVLMIVLGVQSLSYGQIDMKTYLTQRGINAPYTVDLKSYIQAALNADDVRFSGSNNINSPLVYPTTAGIIIPEGTSTTARRKMIIGYDAQIQRMPSVGWLIEMKNFTELSCDSIGTVNKGRIDGNKFNHPVAPFDAVGGTIEPGTSVWVTGVYCLVKKISVFNSCGRAFDIRGGYNSVEYCKAQNCGYIDIKYGQNYYDGAKDSWSGDGFAASYGHDNTFKNCESIDAQRWDYSPSHECFNATVMDCTGKDVNFSTFGIIELETTYGNNKLIRCNNAGGGRNGGEGCNVYGSNYLTPGTPGDSVEDCNLAGTWINLTHGFFGASIKNVNTDMVYIARYLTDLTPPIISDVTISGTFSVKKSIIIENGDFLLNQNGGTITVDANVTDKASYYPHDNMSYSINQYNNGLMQVGGQMILGYRALITGNHDLDGSTLKFKGLRADARLVCGREGAGQITLSNSNITEDVSKAIPMAIRWFESGSGTLSGNGTVGLTGWFVNNGKAIADGNSLDLSSFSSVNTNFSTAGDTAPKDIENTTDNGWYAVNGGKLLLPPVAVGAGNVAVNWGESPADTMIDLVNSARVNFTNATAGQLKISLLARNRAEVRGVNAVGVWDVNFTGTFGGAQIALRYDDADVARLGITASALKIFKSNGGIWQDVTGSVDTTNKVITSSAVTGFSVFAVGKLTTYCGESGTFYKAFDLTGNSGVPDCYVNFADFAAFAASWLCEGDGCYTFSDLKELASEWLSCTDPANQDCQ